MGEKKGSSGGEWDTIGMEMGGDLGEVGGNGGGRAGMGIGVFRMGLGVTGGGVGVHIQTRRLLNLG